MPTIRWTAIIALAIICICLSCGQQEKAEGLAKVGSRVITDADLDQRMEGMPPYMREQLSTPEGRKRLLDGVIEEELLYQDALAKGLDRSEEYKHQLELRKRDILIRQYYDSVVLPRSEPTDAEITEYYESHQDEFHMPASVEVRHILVETKAEAEKLRKRIEAGEDFGKLAEQYSLDQFSKGNGGLISGPVVMGGQIRGLGDVPEFVEASFGLEVGEVSQPVKTAKGYHLILVEKKTPEGVRPLSEVRADIAERLRQEKKSEVRDEVMNELRDKYGVVYLTQAAEGSETPEELFKKASEATNPREKIDYYKQFIERFPDNERAYEAKFMIGFTMAEDLKAYDAAQKEFEEFLVMYPDSDLSDDARWMIENMRSGGQPDFSTE